MNYCKNDSVILLLMIRSQISHQLDQLDELNCIYPWIPNRHQVRPTPNAKLQKAKDNLTVDDVAKLVFGSRGVPRRIAKYKLLPNKYPYQNKGNHYILWYSYVPQSDELINHHIKNELEKQLGHQRFDFAWYLNPKMTIPEIYHVQVFWTEL